MITLSTNSLSVGYTNRQGTKEILKDINLELKSGQLVCLLGINGSGKSTLLRSLAGFQSLLDGSVEMEGQPMRDLTIKERAQKLSVVLTHNVISGMMTVEEVVSLGRYPYTNWLATLSEKDHEMIAESLSLTGMSEERENYFDQLSDGQQQKVIISRAVAQDTPIIILDEPTNHLDIGNKAEILQLLQSLAHEKQKSIIVSTHDLDLALQMADVLWVINENEVKTGSPEHILLDGILESAFPYKGIDLFSGKLIKRATGKKVRIIGKGRTADVTKSAMRRLGFQLTEEDCKVQIEITEDGTWQFQEEGKIMYLENIDDLINQIKGI